MRACMPEVMSELLMLAERELVPEFFDEASCVARVGDLVERCGILMAILLRNDDGALAQGVVEIAANFRRYRFGRRCHRLRRGKTVGRVIEPAAEERRLDKPVPDATLTGLVE